MLCPLTAARLSHHPLAPPPGGPLESSSPWHPRHGRPAVFSWNVAEVTKRSALGQRCHDVTSLPSSPAEPEGRPIPRSHGRYLVGAWPCGHTHLTPTPGFSRQPLPSQQKGLQLHATPKHGLLPASQVPPDTSQGSPPPPHPAECSRGPGTTSQTGPLPGRP